MKMRIHSNYNTMENIKFIFILKFFTLILLIWIYYLKSDKRIFGRYIANEYHVEIISVDRFNRILAKHRIQKELRSHRPREFLSDNIINKNMKNVLQYTSTYGQLYKRGKNDLDSYMRGYRSRYSKKNVLGKLDCYFEKKVFHIIEDIDNLIEKLQNDKKLLKKKLWHKLGIRFILISLIPLIGLIIPLVHKEYFAANFKCFSNCSNIRHYKIVFGVVYTHDNDNNPKAPINGSTWGAIYIVYRVLYCISAFIVLSIIIYIFIKFIKYQRLKACRSKMSIKEYCKFFKSLFL